MAADAGMDLQDVAAVGGRKLTAGGEPRPRLGAKNANDEGGIFFEDDIGGGLESWLPGSRPRSLPAE